MSIQKRCDRCGIGDIGLLEARHASGRPNCFSDYFALLAASRDRDARALLREQFGGGGADAARGAGDNDRLAPKLHISTFPHVQIRLGAPP